MDVHREKIAKLCRFCAKAAKTRNKSGKVKELFTNEFFKYGVNIGEDDDSIHPPLVCQACSRHFYRLRRYDSSESKRIPFTWEAHIEESVSGCVCKDSRGRPPKRNMESVARENNSDTESGEEAEDEKEKDSCSIFSYISQNLYLLDQELAKSLCKEICTTFDLVIIDPGDMLSSVKAIDRQLLLRLVETIFSVERENLKGEDTDPSYKNIGDLLKVSPEMLLASSNLVLNSAVNGMSDTKTQAVKKVMAVDHMLSLVKQNFISPIMFGANLVMYSIARSKMAVNIYGKLHPGGQYTTMKTWVDGLTMEIPTMPEGDILTAIDNDQVLMKKWTVRKDNRAQISILTSVCCAEGGTSDAHLQRDESLAPR